MKLLTPSIFDPFPEVLVAMSMRENSLPGENNMSKNQGDPAIAQKNRQSFVQEIGFDTARLITPQQDHTDIIHVVTPDYQPHTGDGLVCSEPGWLLGITVADCIPLFLYDPETKGYGIVHSGWRGSAQNITGTAITKMNQKFGARPEHIFAWVGPSAGKESYEVGVDVASEFNPRYSTPHTDTSWLFDNKSVVLDQLLGSGLSPDKIEVSSLDTITNHELHSARRGGDSSGRMLAAIGRSQ